MFKEFSQFVIRTPLYPINKIRNIYQYDNLFENILEDKVFIEAIYLASPIVYDEIIKWKENKNFSDKELNKLKITLLKYLSRSCIRCTPFGLFAGFSTGNILNNPTYKSKISIPEINSIYTHTRIDMGFLFALCNELSEHPIIKQNIKFYSNTSCYLVGEKLRYFDYSFDGSNRIYNISSVDHSEYVKIILDKAKEGALIAELSSILENLDIQEEQSLNFIDDLISNQLLISELEPCITGKEFIDTLIEVLSRIKFDGIENILKTIVWIKESFINIDKKPIGRPINIYSTISENLKNFNIYFEKEYLFQTDMVRPIDECFLSNSIAEDVLTGIKYISKFYPPFPKDTRLNIFKEAFIERYEGREIPLLIALDNETGVFYSSSSNDDGDVAPLIEGLDIALPQKNESRIKWDPSQSIIHKKFINAYKEAQLEVIFTDEEFKEFDEQINGLPDTISAMVRVVEWDDNSNGKPLIHLMSFGGSGAANMLGRFCHADEKTNDLVVEMTNKDEEYKTEAIYAEILHLPKSRMGNVLLRPVLHKYEIPYLVRSSVDNDHQITLDDLYLSVKSNRFFLRSKRLNKEIIPRLTTAHNYSSNVLPVYQFLCDMQTQNAHVSMNFNWGALSDEYNFLPRARYNNIILFAAKWKIKKQELDSFFNIINDNELFEKVNNWRKFRKMPNEVMLSEGGNELYINFSEPIFIKMFLSQVKKYNELELEEFLFNHENTLLKSNDGNYTNEIVLAYYKEKIQNN